MNIVSKTIKTDDKHRIVFDHYSTQRDTVVILAHGFYNNKDAFLFKKIAEDFSEKYDVLCFDFRGHGKSSGRFTWTARETSDLSSIIDYAQSKGYCRIGLVGFSLGAAVAIIEVAVNKRVNSLICVSAPENVWKINFHFWEKEMINDLILNLGEKGKGKFIRFGNPFLKKINPIDVVDKVSPVPVLFIHGQKDWLIKKSHSEKLFGKAFFPKKIKIFKNAGHAEKIFDKFAEEFKEECFSWLDETL